MICLFHNAWIEKSHIVHGVYLFILEYSLTSVGEEGAEYEDNDKQTGQCENRLRSESEYDIARLLKGVNSTA